MLDFHIAGGSPGVTLGGVLGFFVILLVGYGILQFVRFLFARSYSAASISRAACPS